MKNLLSKCLLCLGLIMMPIVSWADEEYDTDRGFRHPGGLHTEADFPKHVEYYTLSGLRTESPVPGIYIRRTIHTDGKVEVEKVFLE